MPARGRTRGATPSATDPPTGSKLDAFDRSHLVHGCARRLRSAVRIAPWALSGRDLGAAATRGESAHGGRIVGRLGRGGLDAPLRRGMARRRAHGPAGPLRLPRRRGGRGPGRRLQPAEHLSRQRRSRGVAARGGATVPSRTCRWRRSKKHVAAVRVVLDASDADRSRCRSRSPVRDPLSDVDRRRSDPRRPSRGCPPASTRGRSWPKIATATSPRRVAPSGWVGRRAPDARRRDRLPDHDRPLSWRRWRGPGPAAEPGGARRGHARRQSQAELEAGTFDALGDQHAVAEPRVHEPGRSPRRHRRPALRGLPWLLARRLPRRRPTHRRRDGACTRWSRRPTTGAFASCSTSCPTTSTRRTPAWPSTPPTGGSTSTIRCACAARRRARGAGISRAAGSPRTCPTCASKHSGVDRHRGRRRAVVAGDVRRRRLSDRRGADDAARGHPPDRARGARGRRHGVPRGGDLHRGRARRGRRRSGTTSARTGSTARSTSR